jgi:UDP-3-O-[3-hydroxymyristoyl] glucosamine N-acyltransferase
VSGAPVMPHEIWMKAQAVIPRLPELRQLVRDLARRVERLEATLKSAKTGKQTRKKLGRK